MMKELIWPPWFNVGVEPGVCHVAWRSAAGAQSAARSPFRGGGCIQCRDTRSGDEFEEDFPLSSGTAIGESIVN
jgi:hypothetical protein